MSKKRLGKGLGALLAEPELEQEEVKPIIQKDSLELDIKSIVPNTFQPRKVFDPEKLAELTASIKEHGVVQPIVVRKVEKGYELVVGERRLRACKNLGLKTVPAVIKEYNNEEMTEIALIENIQRHDLNPVEEANAYKILLNKFKLSQEALAKKVGKSRPYIANFLRILQLPEKILEVLKNEKISFGHARSILSLDDEDLQNKVVEKVILENLSVRETEKLIKSLLNVRSKDKKVKKNDNSSILITLQDQLRDKFGTKVAIKNKGNKGKIEIEYYNQDELQRILDLMLIENY